MNAPNSIKYTNIATLSLLIAGSALNLYVNGLPGLFEMIGKATPIITILLTLNVFKAETINIKIFALILNAIVLVFYGYTISIFLLSQESALLPIAGLLFTFCLVFLINTIWLIKQIRILRLIRPFLSEK